MEGLGRFFFFLCLHNGSNPGILCVGMHSFTRALSTSTVLWLSVQADDNKLNLILRISGRDQEGVAPSRYKAAGTRKARQCRFKG